MNLHAQDLTGSQEQLWDWHTKAWLGQLVLCWCEIRVIAVYARQTPVFTLSHLPGIVDSIGKNGEFAPQQQCDVLVCDGIKTNSNLIGIQRMN